MKNKLNDWVTGTKMTSLATTFLLMSPFLYAMDPLESLSLPLLPPDPTHASWVFSGVVSNENGDNYGYFFQMQRNGESFHALSALLDGQSKKIVLLDDSTAVIPHPVAFNWQVGHAFLRFNPINDSWIFGLKTEESKGFNFKVDMLKPVENRPMVQRLRPGVELLVNQTSQLNGHIALGDKEQFVTANKAWFRQIWLTENETDHHAFTGVLCHFNDGSGFYSVHLNEADALRGAVVAGWRNEQGTPTTMSQFIHVKQDPTGPWHIRVGTPNRHLVLSQFVDKPSVVAGFVEQDNTPAFCMLSRDEMGDSATLLSQAKNKPEHLQSVKKSAG